MMSQEEKYEFCLLENHKYYIVKLFLTSCRSYYRRLINRTSHKTQGMGENISVK
jgi:hypothetical protein